MFPCKGTLLVQAQHTVVEHVEVPLQPEEGLQCWGTTPSRSMTCCAWSCWLIRRGGKGEGGGGGGAQCRGHGEGWKWHEGRWRGNSIKGTGSERRGWGK